jgi:hypothetical protein
MAGIFRKIANTLAIIGGRGDDGSGSSIDGRV